MASRRRARIDDRFAVPEGVVGRAVSSQPPERSGLTEETPSVQSSLPVPDPPELQWPAALMTAAEVAEVLRITPKTVRQHIRRGRLRAIRIDGTGPYRVRSADAQAWAESQLVEPDVGGMAVDRYVTSGRRRRHGVPTT